MKKKIILCVSVVVVLCLGCLLFLHFRSKSQVESAPQQTEERRKPSMENVPQFSGLKSDFQSAFQPAEQEQEPEPKEPYVSPIDFETLQTANPDIYAWLSIPGTEAEFPVLQRPGDTFYLTHDADGNYSDAGAIFTESAYNTKTFEEPITVIYGHRMYDGGMFGCLQPTYYDLEQLRAYQQMIIYLPERELHYEIFAAVPYDYRHIMYYYGDGAVWSTEAFLHSISDVRAMDAVVDDEAMANKKDFLTVLSTCLYGDKNKRYLIVGKLTEMIE